MKPSTLHARVLLTAVAAVLFAGCAATAETMQGRDADRSQIQTRIAAIRDAILARSAEGIVRDGTEDWAFTGPDGTSLDRTAFIARTQALFARVPAIETLETKVDRLVVDADTADVEITQTMVRQEADPTTKIVTRVWVRYREHHLWVRTPRGWCVRRVAFIGTPERKPLP